MRTNEIIFGELYAISSRNGIYKPREFHGRGTKIVNMGELFGYDFIGDQPMERIDLTPDEAQKSVLEDGDLLFGRRSLVEAGAGKCSIVIQPSEPLTFESSIIRVRLDRQKVNPRYLFYYFKSPRGRGRISAIVSGTNVKGIRSSDLEKVLVAVPERDNQDAVCSVLGVFDQLIAKNRRRIELLEQSARLLFKEWFVHLRYPGHEHDKVVDGVPNGWARVNLSEMSDIGRGASPRPINLFMGGTVPWFKIGDATASESPFVFESKEHVSQEGAKRSVFLKAGSLIISNSATCGLPCFTGIDGCIHDGWLYFREMRRVGQYFLYCFFHSKRNELVNSVSDGSTQKNLNTDAAGRLSLVLPETDQLAVEFETIARPQFVQISILAKQNMALRKARDLLLPKLMDGRLLV